MVCCAVSLCWGGCGLRSVAGGGELVMLRVCQWLVMALLAVFVAAAVACGSLEGVGAITGEVRFAREVRLPEGSIVTVRLQDTSYADAPSVELGRDVIENSWGLPVRFRVEYDHDRVSDRSDYALSAEVRLGEELLYVNDTVHPVLIRGAPQDSDVVVVSTNPFDRCVEPLPGRIHSDHANRDMLGGGLLHVRLVDVTDSGEPVVVTETTREGLDGFPIEFELPHEGVEISRHRRYELHAEITVGDEVLYHIPNPEWRQIRLPHCPNTDLQLINDVFPASEPPQQ